MAACSAARALSEAGSSASVAVLERMPRPARKVMITGKGRCNFTNVKDWNSFSSHIRSNPNGVYDQGFRKEGDWALNIRSVVAFCRARIVDDTEDDLKRKIAAGLCRKFTDDEAFLQKELTNALPRAAFLELTPEHMTGKLVNES